jgi:hypothetical protein
MFFNNLIRVLEHPARADTSAVGTIMHIDEITRKWKYPARADQAAVGTINRPLQVGESCR